MRTLFILFLFTSPLLHAQTFNEAAIRKDSVYNKLKNDVVQKFIHATPGPFGSFIKGVDEDLVTDKKILALTFDACGGPHGSGYDKDLITFLRKEKIPATLFVTGLWINAHPDLIRELAADSLFEIENHGLNHQPCAIEGEKRYGIEGTTSVAAAVDEVELNAFKIEFFTSRRPHYYRSATATTDEACVEIAGYLGETIISFDLLSGDAVADTPKDVIKGNLLRNPHHGAIVIMHMNHPEWNGYEALREAVPVWRNQGFSFVKIKNHPLKGLK